SILKKNELNVDYEDSALGLSLLNWCSLNDKLMSFEELLRLGGDPNRPSAKENFAPPIIEAARVSTTSSYLKLCLQHGGKVNLIWAEAQGIDRVSPLFGAIYSGRMGSFQVLLDSGANVDLTADSFWTPLAETLTQEQLEMAKKLLFAGANFRKLQFWTLKVAL